jgi:hypothetical protein
VSKISSFIFLFIIDIKFTMNKSYINTFIRNIKKAGHLTKDSDWVFDSNYKEKIEVKYAGFRFGKDFDDVISSNNNFILKFNLSKSGCFLDIYLANKTPFVKLVSKKLNETEKWEIILGELKRNLRKDKDDFIHHIDKAGNLFALIFKDLKK